MLSWISTNSSIATQNRDSPHYADEDLESRDTDPCTALVAEPEYKVRSQNKGLCASFYTSSCFNNKHEPCSRLDLGVESALKLWTAAWENPLSIFCLNCNSIPNGSSFYIATKLKRNISAKLPGDLEQFAADHCLTIQQLTSLSFARPTHDAWPCPLLSLELSETAPVCVIGTDSHTGGFLNFFICAIECKHLHLFLFFVG